MRGGCTLRWRKYCQGMQLNNQSSSWHLSVGRLVCPAPPWYPVLLSLSSMGTAWLTARHCGKAELPPPPAFTSLNALLGETMHGKSPFLLYIPAGLHWCSLRTAIRAAGAGTYLLIPQQFYFVCAHIICTGEAMWSTEQAKASLCLPVFSTMFHHGIWCWRLLIKPSRAELPGEAGSQEKANSPGKKRLHRKSLWFVRSKAEQRFLVVCNYQQREEIAQTWGCFHPADKSWMNPIAGGWS